MSRQQPEPMKAGGAMSLLDFGPDPMAISSSAPAVAANNSTSWTSFSNADFGGLDFPISSPQSSVANQGKGHVQEEGIRYEGDLLVSPPSSALDVDLLGMASPPSNQSAHARNGLHQHTQGPMPAPAAGSPAERDLLGLDVGAVGSDGTGFYGADGIRPEKTAANAAQQDLLSFGSANGGFAESSGKTADSAPGKPGGRTEVPALSSPVSRQGKAPNGGPGPEEVPDRGYVCIEPSDPLDGPLPVLHFHDGVLYL